MLEDMVERYWRIAVVGLGLGLFLGAALFGVLAVSGNSEWRRYLTAEEVLRSTGTFGGVGLLVALAATVGGWAAVALLDRRLEKRPRTRVSMAAAGAAAGTVVLGLLAGILDMAQGSGYWVGLVFISLVLALAAATAAALLVSSAERHHRSAPAAAECPG